MRLVNVLKNEIGEFDEETFQGFEIQYEVIFCILSIEKCDWMNSLVMFKVGEWPTDLIICSLKCLKIDFVHFDEAIIQGVGRPCELCFSIPGMEQGDLEEVA
jgi:hypothetical protein